MKKEIVVSIGTPYKTRAGSDAIAYKDREIVYVETELKNLIKRLTDLEEKYRDRYKDMYLDGEKDCGCYSMDCGCTPTYYLKGRRYETDIEYEHRIAREKKFQADQEERERRAYEELKKKFEGKND